MYGVLHAFKLLTNFKYVYDDVTIVIP